MTIATVRALIGDAPKYERDSAVGDGGSVEYDLANRPVVAGSEKVRVDATLLTATVDYTIDNDLGLITFTIAPGTGSVIGISYQHTIMSDATIQTFLDLEDDDKLAAADALDAIASNEALVQKKMRLLDLATDGPAVAASLREHAKALREQSDGAAFDWAEQVEDVFSARERYWKEWQRGDV